MFTQASCQTLIVLNYLDGICYCIPKPQACNTTEHGLGELTSLLSQALQPDVLMKTYSWEISFPVKSLIAERMKLYKEIRANLSLLGTYSCWVS